MQIIYSYILCDLKCRVSDSRIGKFLEGEELGATGGRDVRGNKIGKIGLVQLGLLPGVQSSCHLGPHHLCEFGIIRNFQCDFLRSFVSSICKEKTVTVTE